MHIPDGYLSPETCVVMYGASSPFWYYASKRIKKSLSGQAAPLLAIFAALSFTIQMLNIPVPPATSAHAVGGTLLAIVLGPWAAVIGVSVALTIQALFFGDGGITALGANVFNMAIALPLAGYAVYSIVSRGAAPASKRRIVAAALGGYVGINVAGLLVAVELGIQPVFWSVGGHALYSPYGLSATIPAMLLTHLTVAGFAEAALTALALVYLARAHPEVLRLGRAPNRGVSDRIGFENRRGLDFPPRPRRIVPRSLVVLLAATILLVPLGLLATGPAEFEWGVGEVAAMVGYVPAGLDGMSAMWQAAPLSGYQVPGIASEAGFMAEASGYVLSAAVGVALIFSLVLVARIVLRRGSRSLDRERSAEEC